jgi:exodeoxyribonuclease-3
MQIISLNVNGIEKATDKGLIQWLKTQKADVICLQNTKISDIEIEQQKYQIDGYFLYSCQAENPQDGGVAIYTQIAPKALISGLGFEESDKYGRFLQVDFDKVSISSLLLPSGHEESDNIDQKFNFMDELTNYLNKQRRKRREYIYCSSLYIAHQKIDVNNWRECQHMIGFTAAERDWLDEIFGSMEFVDSFRSLHREGHRFSWWPDSEQAKMLNLGYRYDYQILTPGLRYLIKKSSILQKPKFSQHAILINNYEWQLSS